MDTDTASELRARYVASFPAKRQAIEGAVRRALGQPEALAALIVLVHRLAGSGASYGFPAISRLCRAMEARLRVWDAAVEPLERAELGHWLDALSELLDTLGSNPDWDGQPAIPVRTPPANLEDRGAFVARLGRELARLARSAEPLTVLFLGPVEPPVAGDAPAAAWAARLMGAIRPYDVLGRCGEHTLGVILTGAGPDRSVRAAERLVLAARGMGGPGPGPCAGLVCCSPDDDRSATEVVECAAAALARATSRGPGSVEMG